MVRGTAAGCQEKAKKSGQQDFSFQRGGYPDSLCGKQLGLDGLHLYRLRHGGATEDLCAKHRDFHGVKQRGRWLTDQSVRRYAKTGRVQLLLNKLDHSSMRYCMWAEKNTRKVFMGVVPPQLTNVFEVKQKPRFFALEIFGSRITEAFAALHAYVSN